MTEKNKITYRNIQRVLAVISKIVTTDTMIRWGIAERKCGINAVYATFVEAATPPDDIIRYNEEQNAIFRMYGLPLTGGGFEINKSKNGVCNDEVCALNERYADVLAGEVERERGIKELLRTEVEIEIEPLVYEWLGPEIDVDDVEVLLELGMVTEPVENAEN